jgi:formamidase
MTRHLLEVDAAVSLQDDHTNSHNRWHPEIPPCLEVDPGDEVVFECRDGFDGQIHEGASAADLARLELGREHPLTGPVRVRGAEPGDVLAVDVIGVDTATYGFSAIFAGFSRLVDRFTVPWLSHWHISDGAARSPEIPGVTIRGRPFLGILGVAPSAERMKTVREREQQLAEQGCTVMLPTAKFAVPDDPLIAGTGLRTMTPRENGGNWDVESFGVGSTVYLPVEVGGALLSAGDPHFRQGDGEVSGAAIETSAFATLRVGLVKSANARWVPTTPAATERRPPEPGGDWLVTTGVPVGRDGVNREMDLLLAVDRALDQMVDRVAVEYGYDEAQAFNVVGVAVQLRVSMIVAAPNCTVTACLPRDVFDRDGS